MAEEVHFLYPEGDWALEQRAGDPGHELFKHFGTQVPAEDWNAGGTKQGIYMMGPNGEYLEGAHAASGRADHLRWRMERALERWEALKAEADYADQPVPLGDAVAPPAIEAAPLALRVSLRDLPRESDPDAGRRITSRDKRDRRWIAFTNWAWNQNWITFDDPLVFVPRAVRGLAAEADADAVGTWEAVSRNVVRRIARNVLVDNVRGQTSAWLNDAVQVAELEMRFTARDGELVTLEYRGSAALANASATYAPTLCGRAVWNLRTRSFVTFSLVAIGTRSGTGTFNQRAEDPGPAPMGIVLDLFVPATRESTALPLLPPGSKAAE